MTETVEATTLIWKGQPGNWVNVQPIHSDTDFEVVGTCIPHLKPKGYSLEQWVEGCRKWTTYPEEVLQELVEECELIPITVTYTY